MSELTNIEGVIIYRREIGVLPSNPNLKDRAKALRKAGVLSEVLFWLCVKSGQFHNLDFDRQRVIGNYIVDFYVKSLGLVIEIDGSSHENKEDYDAERQSFLENLGLRVYRIADSRVKKELNMVMKELEDYIIEQFSKDELFNKS